MLLYTFLCKVCKSKWVLMNARRRLLRPGSYFVCFCTSLRQSWWASVLANLLHAQISIGVFFPLFYAVPTFVFGVWILHIKCPWRSVGIAIRKIMHCQAFLVLFWVFLLLLQGYRKIRRMLSNFFASDCSVVFFFQGMSFFCRFRVVECVRECKLTIIFPKIFFLHICVVIEGGELDKFSSLSWV